MIAKNLIHIECRTNIAAILGTIFLCSYTLEAQSTPITIASYGTIEIATVDYSQLPALAGVSVGTNVSFKATIDDSYYNYSGGRGRYTCTSVTCPQAKLVFGNGTKVDFNFSGLSILNDSEYAYELVDRIGGGGTTNNAFSIGPSATGTIGINIMGSASQLNDALLPSSGVFRPNTDEPRSRALFATASNGIASYWIKYGSLLYSTGTDPAVGTIESVSGELTIQAKDGSTRAGVVGALLYSGDTLITGPTDTATIQFLQDNIFTLGRDAEIEMGVLLAEEEYRSIVKVNRGTFSFTSGALTTPESLPTILTHNLNIGIRGTILETGISDDGISVRLVEGGPVDVGTPTDWLSLPAFLFEEGQYQSFDTLILEEVTRMAISTETDIFDLLTGETLTSMVELDSLLTMYTDGHYELSQSSTSLLDAASITAVPEPPTFLMFVIGLVGLVWSVAKERKDGGSVFHSVSPSPGCLGFNAR